MLLNELLKAIQPVQIAGDSNIEIAGINKAFYQKHARKLSATHFELKSSDSKSGKEGELLSGLQRMVLKRLGDIADSVMPDELPDELPDNVPQ